jgi:hypothetical protein
MSWSTGNRRQMSPTVRMVSGPGVRHDDHVGVRAGPERRHGPSRPRREEIGQVTGARGRAAAARMLQTGIELQRRLHDRPRPPPVDAQQLVDEQEGVSGPAVPAQHDRFRPAGYSEVSQRISREHLVLE